MDSYYPEEGPTIFPHPHFNPEEDARALHKALASELNESLVMQILAKRSNVQRQEILAVYSEKFGKNLLDDVSGTCAGKSCKLIMAMLQTHFNYLAHEIDRSLSVHLGSPEDVIIEILCTRSADEIKSIAFEYQNVTDGKTIRTALINQSIYSTDCRDLIGELLSSTRYEFKEPNQEKTKMRAEALHNAVQESWSTSKKIFSRLLTHEPFQQLCLVFDEYRIISGQAMQETVKSALSGDLERACMTIVKSAINTAQYYAESLEAALKKFRTDDATLTRIIVSRSELDLQSVKSEYLKIYHKTLYHAVKTATSGVYREGLLLVIGLP